MMKTASLIALYLGAIVIANLTVAWFGPAVVIVNALILVSLDLTARDRLHQAWKGRNLVRNMALLILSGSALSAALDYQAVPVAVASCLAFGMAATVDTLVYSLLGGRPWLIRANGSNLMSAFVDSAVFLSVLASYGLLPWALVPLLVVGQWGAKILGGAVWSIILVRRQPI
jgi:queuosine precursor transporter